MKWKSIVKVVTFMFITLMILAGCASTPKRTTKSPEVTFEQPVLEVRKAAIGAFVVLGFDIKKEEEFYIEGSRPRKSGLFTSSGGETVGIWLDTVKEDGTRVTVSTARSLYGIAGQKIWDNDIIAEMENSLKEKQ